MNQRSFSSVQVEGVRGSFHSDSSVQQWIFRCEYFLSRGLKCILGYLMRSVSKELAVNRPPRRFENGTYFLILSISVPTQRFRMPKWSLSLPKLLTSLLEVFFLKKTSINLFGSIFYFLMFNL